jgi:hypothetical protein
MRTTASLRSSFFANRPRAALWIAALVVGIGLIVAVLLGMRSHDTKPQVSPRRTAVAAYIVRVGRIQVGMGAAIRTVDRQYRKFAKDPGGLAQHVGEYRKAERTLARLRDKLAAVTPPPEARALHALLVKLATQNVGAASAVTSLAVYLPRLADARAPLRQAVLSLRTGLKTARTAKTQAAAFDAYAASTGAVATTIERLEPPAFFRQAQKEESSQLRHTAALASGIADDLRRKQAAAAQALLHQLSAVSSGTALARAQRAGVLAYDARLDAIRTTAKQIEKERKALEKRVPA